MSKSCAVLLLVLSVLIAGCAQIPQAAIDVNRQVSSGISALGQNGQDLIAAWEETGYAILNDRWSQIYKNADTAYRTKKNIVIGTALTAQQQEEVAGMAVLVRDAVRTKIRDEASILRKTVSSNTAITLEANDSITALLISANSVLSGQQSALKQVVGLVPIPPAIGQFVTDAIAAIK
ncbi:MAG: hypothetical protein IPK02_18650 [Candidatus Accumulibacter sp.]|uniref:Lipoprotein n=1 Tax=Candidatus Accumulibacter affinis TaxID=2954384 RepID=A0A935TE87_9PROT|nr:hypothetical protein [Candidatus Accumulibacter affinis]